MKIFRKLRFDFIKNKKTGNYLKYAIGEIILVVIGILIALAINNAAQNNALKQKEKIYLTGLQNEFKTSKRKLEELIGVNRNNYESAKAIIMSRSSDSIALDEKEFAELLNNAFAFDVSFTPNNSNLTEMLNSGSLKDISNKQLRLSLTNWISILEDISRQESDLARQREKVIDMFRNEQYSIRTLFELSGISKELGLPKKKMENGNLNILNSKEFENNVLIFILTAHATEVNHYQPLMQNLESILLLLEGELTN